METYLTSDCFVPAHTLHTKEYIGKNKHMSSAAIPAVHEVF